MCYSHRFSTQPVKSPVSALDLNRLKSTLCTIKLAIEDIDIFNKILNRPRVETEAFAVRLLEGEELVRKCSTVKRWNVFMRLYYAKKLSKLENSLINFFQIDVAALHFRESKRISVLVSDLEEKINQITTMLERCEIRACDPDTVPVVVVGFQGMPPANDGGR
ncbi:hypothetical protein ABFS82_08G046300 [Erythranthe guttata]